MHRSGTASLSSLAVLIMLSACGDDPTPTTTSGTTSAVGTTSATATGATATASTTVTATVSATADLPPVTSGSVSPATPTASATTKPTASATASAKPTSTPTATASSAPTASAVPTETTAPLPTPKAGSADELAERVDEIYRPPPRFKARFHQKYTIKVQNKTKEQDGTVIIERPNKISFKYDPPNQNRVVSDGTTIKIYTADDKQMIVTPVKGTEYPGAFGFIMGQGMRRSFSFEFNDKVKFDYGPVLLGTPTTPNPQYDKVLFYIDKAKVDKKDAGAVAGVLILDVQGNRNRFEFSDPSFPTTVDPNEFSFTPPAGTSILDK